MPPGKPAAGTDLGEVRETALRRTVYPLCLSRERRYDYSMESQALVPVTATLTKVLHRYGNLEVQETMRFANRALAEDYRKEMLGKHVSRPVAGSAYTVVAVSF